MTRTPSKIETLKQLRAEKYRLTLILKDKETSIKDQVRDLVHIFRPIRKILSFFQPRSTKKQSFLFLFIESVRGLLPYLLSGIITSKKRTLRNVFSMALFNALFKYIDKIDFTKLYYSIMSFVQSKKRENDLKDWEQEIYL